MTSRKAQRRHRHSPLSEEQIAANMVEYRAEQARLIRENGWSLQGVFDPEGVSPPFTYTIGLGAHGGAEYLIAGIDPNDAGHILNDLGVKLSEGWRPDDEIVTGLFINDLRARLVEMGPDNEAFQARRWWRELGEGDVRIVQVLFPDPQGRLPGEAGCDAVYANNQRVPGSRF